MKSKKDKKNIFLSKKVFIRVNSRTLAGKKGFNCIYKIKVRRCEK